MQFKNRYTQVLSGVVISFLIFFAARIFLYLSYFDYFNTLTLQELFFSFVNGFRVDMAEIFTFTFLLWFLLLVPFRFTFSLFYRKIIGIVWGIIIGVISYFNIADTLYFGFVNRHVGDELSVIGNDVGILVDMALHYYFTATIVTTLLFFGVVVVFYKIFSAQIQSKNYNQKEWLSLFGVLIIAFLGIRGKVTGISFGISDAFASPKLASGNLALNGFFCYYRAGKRDSLNHSKIPLEEALSFYKKEFTSKKAPFINQKYPLLKSFTQAKKTNYNIVIVLIESLSGKYLDALTHHHLGVTPNLDKLANEGILFTNFYANGQRSIEGITSIYTGLIQPVGFEPFGEGLELYKPSYLAQTAKENGYHTLAMQSSPRGSYKIDGLSYLAGFSEYYGAEDMPKVGDEVGKPHFGVWDGDMFAFLAQKLHTIKEPFLTFTFTASTHAPYHLPGKKWAKYPHATNTENGFLNTMYYVDAQIGAFMQKMKKEPWFDRTIFIFSADHCNKAPLEKELNLQTKTRYLSGFRIPLIIYAPKIFQPQNNAALGSHLDIPATIFDILGFNTPFASLGNSLFDATKKVVMVKKGDTIGITDLKGSTFYNFNTFLDEKNASKELKDTLLSIDSVEANLLKQSKWRP